MMLRSLFLLAAALAVGACSLPKNAVCEADDDCGDLVCVTPHVSDNDSCDASQVQSCSATCSSTADCGESEECLPTCDDGVSACFPRLGEDLPFSAECEAGDTCAEGLSCLPAKFVIDETCQERNLCSIVCTVDDDCADVGGSCVGCDDTADKVCIN